MRGWESLPRDIIWSIRWRDAGKFIEEVGYPPVVVKPDNGVGASHTYRLENQEQLEEFMQTKRSRCFLYYGRVCL